MTRQTNGLSSGQQRYAIRIYTTFSLPAHRADTQPLSTYLFGNTSPLKFEKPHNCCGSSLAPLTPPLVLLLSLATTGSLLAAHCPLPSAFSVLQIKGALAALGSMTGKIAWRQLLPSSHSIDRVLLKNSMLITVSAGGSRVQRWDRDSGLQLWQHANHAFTDGRSGNGGDADRWGSGVDASILEEQDITTVISLAGNILTSRRVKDGEATWQTSVCDGAAATAATDGDEPSAAAAANGNDACSMRLVALGSDGQLVTYGTTADSIVVKTFTLRGKATGTKTFAINSANKVQGFKSCQIVGGDNLMCIGSEAGAVHMLWNNAEGITTVNVEGEDVAFSSFDAVADDSVEPVALIRYVQPRTCTLEYK